MSFVTPLLSPLSRGDCVLCIYNQYFKTNVITHLFNLFTRSQLVRSLKRLNGKLDGFVSLGKMLYPQCPFCQQIFRHIYGSRAQTTIRLVTNNQVQYVNNQTNLKEDSSKHRPQNLKKYPSLLPFVIQHL